MVKGLLKSLIHLIAGILVLPVALPYLCTRSRGFFSGGAQLLSLIPGKSGSYMRVAYYSFALERCHRSASIGFGTFFAHPEAEVGKGVYIGSYCIVGMARIGDHVTIGSGVHLLSGKHQHGFREIGKPIQEQPGEFIKITIGENCWIGNGSVVMADLGRQNVVAAGTVVVQPTCDHVIVAGNPGKPIKSIDEDRR
jgi:virginiamycin A acetyltransferase